MISNLAGLRILVVEDEMLVCMDIEDMLEGFGCVIIGPAARVAQALTLLEKEDVDIALLDVNLGREKSYPIVDRLMARGIPFLLSTGYAEIDPPYDQCPKVQKPYSDQQLAKSLEVVLRTA
ncbi:response regulator [Paracoccus sediminis]|uniref:Response regulator n=1 Tax=Paracoccus sediminis TaxID=1214787 RepID=A0A238XW08_9RHOB|nr:response regulator [Paracoccus sediminis]TBN47820.1 response regulator [Paracoccus sediminis]SNR62711.1 Response regulator receiver domain-containing protein [Paracoccus sediminis]